MARTSQHSCGTPSRDREGTEIQYDANTTTQLLGVAADVLLAIGDPGILHHVAIVGGLVPTLMAYEGLTPSSGQHIGTGDLDLHLTLELLEGNTSEYYGNVIAALRRLGLDVVQEQGRDRRWRWQGRHRDVFLTVELLSPTRTHPAGSPQALPAAGTRAQSSVGDADDIRTLGLDFGHLVHIDRAKVARTVETRDGTLPDFAFPIAGIASWLALKVDALDKRDKSKDAYDVVWLLECLGPREAAQRTDASALWTSAHRDDLAGQLDRLEVIFAQPDHVGPGRYARFLQELGYPPLRAGDITEARLRRDAVEIVAAFTRARAQR